MDSTHIIDPSFRIISNPSASVPQQKRFTGAAQKARSAGAHLAKAADILLFGLLERLGLCALPRVTSVECLAEEKSA